MPTAIEFNNISKQYRLGLVSTKTISHDLNRWWQTSILRKEDPYLKIGEANNRAIKGDSDYVWALRDIDFKVEQGDVLGIIGKNGAGKSTLLKILSKVTAPTTGSIRARGRIASLLEVGTGFHPEMTGRENIFMNGAIMGMTKREISRKMDEIIDFAGVERYIDTPTKRYSSGMTVRLGFAIAAHLDPEILVVDEVLAVGDAEFQKKAIGKMQDVSKGEGRTVLFVSHNMASMRQLCNNGVLLENGAVSYSGGIDDVISYYMSTNIDCSTTVYKPEKSVVKRISVEQTTSDIKFILDYEADFEIKIPNFGFVVYDKHQHPLFGSNPIKSGFKEFGISKNRGSVEVKIAKPILVNGTYFVSVWFNDGIAHGEHLLKKEYALKFNIEMAEMNLLTNPDVEGYFTPNYNWKFI